MKKIFLSAIAIALLAGSAQATIPCSQYGPDCYDNPHGLDKLMQIHPLLFPNGDHPYYDFSEEELDSLGLDEYVAYDGENPDVAQGSQPNPLTVTAIQELKVIVDGKLDAFTPGTAPAAAATNAATNAPTNLTVLSVLSNEANATNTKQNDLATKYNDLAGKFNALVGVLASQGIVE